MNIETELIGNEIKYLHPHRATWKDSVETLLAVAVIAGLTYVLYILAAIDFAAQQ